MGGLIQEFVKIRESLACLWRAKIEDQI